ncbi:MAG: type II toxin-antitoxin system YafQ family toxin [bacterium]|nr:type II toxin-antitoxin system YafQ family toxin [bacterium]
MLKFVATNKFKKDLQRMLKQGKSPEKLKRAISLLLSQQPLPPKYQNHKLTGIWRGRLECHLEPDWLLIYLIKDGKLIVERTGSHPDLFG